MWMDALCGCWMANHMTMSTLSGCVSFPYYPFNVYQPLSSSQFTRLNADTTLPQSRVFLAELRVWLPVSGQWTHWHQHLCSQHQPHFSQNPTNRLFFVGFSSEMAYLAQPVIVRSPNVNDLDGGLDANPPAVNLSGNIVRSSHYIPDPSSGSPSTDPYTLHPTLKSLPYPLALPPVVNTSTTIATSGADLANFEEDEEDADTEDSRSLLSSITYESLGDNVLAPSTSPSNLIGSFRESTNAMPGSSGSHGPLRGQSSLLANVRPSPYSPVTYHRIPVGAAHTYPVIPTVPGAAVAGSYPIDGNGNGPSSSMLFVPP